MRKIFKAAGIDLDTYFISIVPLGGRHVNHFWRLLAALKIPYMTILDLDFGKEHGGWQKLQYIRNQLVAFYPNNAECLNVTFGEGDSAVTENLSNTKYDTYFNQAKSFDRATIEGWANHFRKFGVYFSYPLDIDFAMLGSFLTHYQDLIYSDGGKGPRLPKEKGASYEKVCRKRMWQVLGYDDEEKQLSEEQISILNFYSQDEQELYPWYKYIFIDGSKPATHMRATLNIPGNNWESTWPTCLVTLVNAVKSRLGN